MVLFVRYDISCGVSSIVSPGRNGFRLTTDAAGIGFRHDLSLCRTGLPMQHDEDRCNSMTEAGAWTDDRVELLKKLWNDGLSASQIAAELGNVTRNAVIGKVHRLGLSGRAKSPGSATPRPRKPVSRPPSHPAGHQNDDRVQHDGNRQEARSLDSLPDAMKRIARSGRRAHVGNRGAIISLRSAIVLFRRALVLLRIERRLASRLPSFF